MTGGLAPTDKTAEQVYQATFRKAVERNQAYFRKYPRRHGDASADRPVLQRARRPCGRLARWGAADVPTCSHHVCWAREKYQRPAFGPG